jgi:hypothetical protein
MKTARRRKIERSGYEILAKRGDNLYIAEGKFGDMLMIKFDNGVVKGWFGNTLTNEQIEKMLTKPKEFIEEFNELTTKIKPQWHAFEENWMKWNRPNWPSDVL